MPHQVLRGLQWLHDQGVCHRDIKGANLLITKDGKVKLADFGVARKISEDSTQRQAAVVGTPYWMAPEVIQMSAFTTASDIWSLGCTILELLNGEPPYYDLKQITALYRIVQVTPACTPCLSLVPPLASASRATAYLCLSLVPPPTPLSCHRLPLPLVMSLISRALSLASSPTLPLRTSTPPSPPTSV